jgi:hypothetical protein
MADHGCSQLSQPVTCHVRFRTDSSRPVRFPAAQGAENVPTSECLDAQQMRFTSAAARALGGTRDPTGAALVSPCWLRPRDQAVSVGL